MLAQSDSLYKCSTPRMAICKCAGFIGGVPCIFTGIRSELAHLENEKRRVVEREERACRSKWNALPRIGKDNCLEDELSDPPADETPAMCLGGGVDCQLFQLTRLEEACSPRVAHRSAREGSQATHSRQLLPPLPGDNGVDAHARIPSDRSASIPGLFPKPSSSHIYNSPGAFHKGRCDSSSCPCLPMHAAYRPMSLACQLRGPPTKCPEAQRVDDTPWILR